MFHRRGLEAQSFHQELLILFIECCRRHGLGPGYQLAHDPVMPGAMGEDHEFVLRVKPHQSAAAPSASTKAIPPSLYDENALDEVRAELRIMEASVILNRDEREMVHKGPGKKPLTCRRWCALSLNAVDPHPLYAAARRFPLKDKTAQVRPFQFPHLTACPAEHTLCMILLAARGDELGGMGITYQAEGLPGDAEPAPHLRADGVVPGKPPQLIGEPWIQFVPAVPADLLPEQTGADSQTDDRVRHPLAIYRRRCDALPSALTRLRTPPALRMAISRGRRRWVRTMACPLVSSRSSISPIKSFH
jgi:hypothetical protein